MKSMTLAVLAALLSLPAHAAVYEIDAVHSEVAFKVRHMMLGKTAGKFTKFSGTFDYDGKAPKSWKTKAVIDAASIDTADAKRDGHLRSPDFFDVERHPTLEFSSAKVTGWKDGKGKLHGELTMHGVTKPVVLDLELAGETEMGAGFTARTKVDRREFGIVWNKALDKGGVAVGNEVEITLEIEGKKAEKKAEAK